MLKRKGPAPKPIPENITSPTELGKVLGVSRQRAHQILHRQEATARHYLYQAVKAGDIVKPSKCDRCHTKAHKIEAHHWDYNLPYDVRWLCIKCHKTLHSLAA